MADAQNEQSEIDAKSFNKEMDNLFLALEAKGKKLRFRSLARLLSLLSIGSILAILGLTSTIIGGAFTLGMKYANLSEKSSLVINGEVGWGSIQGAEAINSFLQGGDATKLSGVWNAEWWVDLPNGGEEKYSYMDENGNKVIYPKEKIYIQSHQAVVSCKVEYSSGEDIWYWYEGRHSDGNHVTLIYWVERGDEREKLVGVVFLEFKDGLKGNRKSKLSGRWIGYVRDGIQVEGRTEWTKED